MMNKNNNKKQTLSAVSVSLVLLLKFFHILGVVYDMYSKQVRVRKRRKKEKKAFFFKSTEKKLVKIKPKPNSHSHTTQVGKTSLFTKNVATNELYCTSVRFCSPVNR